ncbi:hypothetical protein AVV27_gp60 [Achromobacter phage 83-24]|uniref:Uncharacterized protein n=1 Tax=Achromobacter phage 83-24 TaxID=1589747 RepID=A0A0B5A6W2_9CAUD|nr:hypothetical protein AVV27_gp60 [Achromobacter phage 83-24]AJD82881.1 hypothetical protein JWAP_00049 [Achromobacter phage 83-24]
MTLSRKDERRVRELKQVLEYAQTVPNRRRSFYQHTIQAAVREMIYNRLVAFSQEQLRKKLASEKGTGRATA